MSSSSKTGNSSTPRIQISLSKDQRKNMAAAAAASTPAKASDVTANASAYPQKTIDSVMAANPGLYKSVRKALKNQTLNFKINVECTSLKISPSGNFLWGGFSDGTLRVWDLSGTFGVEDDDVIASRQKTDVLVNSKLTQGYGAVACQIHARGVHTDLITTVDISDDAQYVFVGVARGAMELHAVFVGDLERAVHTHKQRERDTTATGTTIKRNILDYIKVYCHSDAKLKGFGACATMRLAKSSQPPKSNNAPSSYLLLTGKGIKNIHIWKFTPPEHPHDDEEELDESRGRNRKQSICDPPEDEEDHGIWDQLYDTSTNGNTIVLLGFYRNPQNKLLAVSKSDAQKLRLWDLSLEENSGFASEAAKDKERPKRPPYKDVANSQSALEIAGGIGVCGGGNMYNEMSIVSLDRPDNPFNHTELALPSSSSSSNEMAMAYSSRRQRRGEMKAVVNVAASPRDSSHALLELDDGSLVGYSAGSSSSSSMDSSGSIPKLAIATPESTGIPALPADFWRRCICLANIAGVVIAASSLYNPNTNKGQLVIRALGGLKKPRGSEITEKKKMKLLRQQQKRERLEEERLERQREAMLLQQQQRELEKQNQQGQEATAAPKTPSPIHTNLQSSPLAADTNALREAVSAPKAVPVSVLRTNKNPLESKAQQTTDSHIASTQSASSSAPLTRVSPNGTMETPRHQKNTPNEDDDSPDSTQGLPKISQFLQPKRIDMQAKQLQEQSKKRKAEQPKETEAAQSSSAATITDIKKARKAQFVSETKEATTAVSSTSASPMPMFQLNNIGSIPFKSPKPQIRKPKKVSAPSKPKKLASVSSTSFSTPKASRDAPGKDSQMKVESRVVVPAKSSEKPKSKVMSATGDRKRDRAAVETGVPATGAKKIARTSDDVSTALLLTSLASPNPGAKAGESVYTTPKTSVPTGKPSATATVTPKVAAAVASQSKTAALKKPSNSASKSKGKSTTPPNASNVPQIPSREEILHEKISEQYQQLRTFLKSISDRSMAFIHSRNLRGPIPSALSSSAAKRDANHVGAYSKLLAEHRATHDYLQKRLLLSAETTLRLLLECRITAEEARTELKQSIKKFEEILCDTLRRQEMERVAVVSQHYGSSSNFARNRNLPGGDSCRPSVSTKEQSNYPCKEAFDKVEDICTAITRPVGRPRSALAALRN